jgi:hypothetical protein
MLETLITTPRSRMRWGKALRVVRTALMKLSSQNFCQLLSGSPVKPVTMRPLPTLLTSTSSRPCRSRHAATARSPAPASRMSSRR